MRPRRLSHDGVQMLEGASDKDYCLRGGGPGYLPDVLATEKIRFDLSNPRSPVLTFHVVRILLYRGAGYRHSKEIAHLRLGAVR